jgi:hypothetical protein
MRTWAEVVDERGKLVGHVHGTLSTEGTELEYLDLDVLRELEGELPFHLMSFNPRAKYPEAGRPSCPCGPTGPSGRS